MERFNHLVHVLSYLCDRLEGLKERWVIGGSTASLLQGMRIKPGDIDILTSEKGAFQIEKRLNEYVKRRIEYKETNKYKSYFGIFNIKDINVEICGELYLIYHGLSFPYYPPFLLEKRIFINRKKIRVVSLENQLWINLIEKREERAKHIAHYLKKVGFDKKYIKKIILNPNIPEEIKSRVRFLLGLGYEN